MYRLRIAVCGLRKKNPKSEIRNPRPCGHDNFLYKKWCEETFDNGRYIYEAYKNIAFNIRYTPELNRADFWQTPIETTNLNKGDCEDAVLLFFSQITPNQKNVEIIWGWVIDNRNSIGRAHVWYQLTDKKGRKYIVEGFSNDWNGIIPVEIVSEVETRKPILTISHCMASRLSRLFPKVDDWQMCQTLIDLFTGTGVWRYASTVGANGRSPLRGNLPARRAGTPLLHLRLSDYEFIEYPSNMRNSSRRFTQFLSYRPGMGERPFAHTALYMNKEISNIMKKLHEVFSRFENQKKKVG